eukprot:1582100-Pyramimonas_sp.AAC.1
MCSVIFACFLGLVAGLLEQRSAKVLGSVGQLLGTTVELLTILRRDAVLRVADVEEAHVHSEHVVGLPVQYVLDGEHCAPRRVLTSKLTK